MPSTSKAAPPPASIIEALSDDLNVSKAISEMRTLAKESRFDIEAVVKLAAAMDFLGFDWDQPWSVPFGSSLDHLLDDFGRYETLLHDARNEAKKTKDFTRADRIRDALLSAGLEVRISKEGVVIDRTPDFDPTKLEGLN